MREISFWADGEPKGQPRPRAFAIHGKVRMYDPATAEGWKNCIASAFLTHYPSRPEPFEGAVRVGLDFWMPRPKAHYRGKGQELRATAPQWHVNKPDIDNLQKSVLDALTTLRVWTDDTQVAQISVTKRYVHNGSPGCHISVHQLDTAPMPDKEPALL